MLLPERALDPESIGQAYSGLLLGKNRLQERRIFRRIPARMVIESDEDGFCLIGHGAHQPGPVFELRF